MGGAGWQVICDRWKRGGHGGAPSGMRDPVQLWLPSALPGRAISSRSAAVTERSQIPPAAPAPKTVIEQFRAKTIRQRIHPREQALLWTVAAQLVFLPWALGGMRQWGQEISLGLSVVAFVVALSPRDYDETTGGQVPFRLYTWPKLVRFPIFWLGLAFLGYIVVQALNPAWVYQTDGKSWWMKKNLDSIEWLPSGVDVPIEMWGPWRMLMIYASVWLTVCAAWIGFTRRKSLQTLFSVLAGNAFLLAGLGIAERALGAKKIFWFWQPPASYFVSSFVYKNHAGAYFNLLLSLCAGLAYWHYERSQRRLDKSSPSGLFGFFGTAVAMIVFFSYSRTATILMFVFLIVALLLFFWNGFMKTASGNRPTFMLAVLLITFLAFVRIGLTSLRTEKVIERLSELREQFDFERVGTRTRAAEATWDMARERLLTGWGAGSFRFIFPIFQQHYPEIYADHNHRFYWDHAHNDYIEFLAEFGIIGVAIILAGSSYTALKMVKTYAWENPLTLFLSIGILVSVVHSIVDFNFYNPAILTTWCVLLYTLIRWSELEEVNSPP